MTRTLVLILTHLISVGCGAGLVYITLRGRAAALEVRSRALQMRELFVEELAARPVNPRPVSVDSKPGRHRADRVARTRLDLRRIVTADELPRRERVSLLPNATLAEAEVFLATAEAQRVQERRQFVDIMNGARRMLEVTRLSPTRMPQMHVWPIS